MLLEQIIANNPSLQPYEYINTEIAEDGHRIVLHLASRKDTAEERCPYCNGHVHILGFNIPISTVQRITGVHWDTVKHIQKEIMNGAVVDRRRELLMQGYKPENLAVEDFAVLYLFSYIHNPLRDKYEKIENLIK